MTEVRFDDADRAARLGLMHWHLDPAGRELRLHGDWAPVLGADAGAGRVDPDRLSAALHPDDRAAFRAALDARQPAALTLRMDTPAGRPLTVVSRLAPQPDGLAGVWVPLPDPAPVAAADPGALDRRLAAAESAAALFRSALECLPDGAFLLDAEGRFIIANDRVRSLFPLMADTMIPGRPFEEMLRIGIARGAYPEAVGREEAWLAGALAFLTRAEPTVERTVRLASGRWVMAVDRRLPGGGWIGLRVDITDLKQSESRLAAILDGSGHGTWEYDVASDSFLSNPLIDRSVDHWLASVGYRRDDVETTPPALFRAICHPEDRDRLDAEYARHIAGETDHIDIELRQRHRDGRWVWARMCGKISDRDPEGRPLRVAGVLIDIDHLKTAQTQLERSARLKVEFLERISHELRTPLNGVLGAVSLLSSIVTDPAQRDLLAVAEQSGESLVAMIDRLVELTRLEDGRVSFDLAPLRLDRLAQGLRDSHGAAADRRGIRLDVLTDLHAADPRIGDARRLTEVLDRLVTHCLHRPGTTTVELRVRSGPCDEVRIDLRDDGPPLDDDTRSRALEPFFHAEGNARAAGAGDGLGLWPTRRMVEAMGGTLRLLARPEGGMLARIELPLPHAPAA